jgi:light-regulated signal transduction histidine kinase (bacteriophytochrome)
MDLNRFSAAVPGFGSAALSNCEREQIHLPASIQPHGALLAIDSGARVVSRVSQNISDFFAQLGQQTPGQLLDTLPNPLATQLTDAIEKVAGEMPVVTSVTDAATDRQYDCVVHRSAGGELVLEFEHTEAGDTRLAAFLQSAIESISTAESIRAVCDIAAALFHQMLDYDRVMVYRFDPDGHGEIFSEAKGPGVESYLGNHYPAADIPQIARKLYCEVRVRMLPDVDYEPVDVVPLSWPDNTADGTDAGRLNMARSQLRSMSPIHREYLRNMGVRATLVASIATRDRLWGLITCHHLSARTISFEKRAAAELLSEIVATRIAALESYFFVRAEHAVQRFEQQIVDLISADGSWLQGVMDRPESILGPVDATGLALVLDDDIVQVRDTPSTRQLRELANWIGLNHPRASFFCNSLNRTLPELGPFPSNCAGVLCAPLSPGHTELAMWFRPEQVRTVQWGGDPNKFGKDADDMISPRRSFKQWRELLKDTTVHWSATDLYAAGLIGNALSDIVQQFRSVQLLVAHKQLDKIIARAEESQVAAAIFDAEGQALLVNSSFRRQLWEGAPELAALPDLVRLFDERQRVQHGLTSLKDLAEPWRTQISLNGKAMVVRADPIVSTPGTLLGYVVLLNDVSELVSEKRSKERLSGKLLNRYRRAPSGSGPVAVATYNRLLEAVFENAQLAAIEITDGTHSTRVPGMLKDIEESVSRSSSLLGSLVARLDHSNG